MIYLLLQVAGAILVSLFQNKIIGLITLMFPESEEESIAKTKYIYPEAGEDPDIAVRLTIKEQDRIIASLSSYLEPLRNTDDLVMPVSVRNAAYMQLANEIKQFIDEISHHESGQGMTSILELQSRNEAIISLLSSLNTFVTTVAETKNHGDGLSGSIVESLHFILILMEETVLSDENMEILIEFTSDKSQLMDNIRDRLFNDVTTSMAERQSLYVSTRVYERVLWQLRQMLTSQNQSSLKAIALT